MKRILNYCALATLLGSASLLVACYKSPIIDAGVATIQAESEKLNQRGDPMPMSFQRVWTKSGGHANSSDFPGLRPAVNNKLVITADKMGELFARDAETGRVVWQSDVSEQVSSGPVLDHSMVIVGSASGTVFSLDARSGQKIWSHRFDSSILALPTVTEADVYVKSFDGCVSRLARDDGNLHWKYCHESKRMSLHASSAVVVENGIAVTGFPDGQVIALDVATGELRWQQTLAEPQVEATGQRLVDVSADPVISEEVVYVVNFNGALVAMSLDSGEVLWKHQLSSNSGLTLNHQHVFAADTQGAVSALSVDSGMQEWQQSKLPSRRLTAPVLLGDTLVFGDDQGYLLGLSSEDGHIVAQTRVDSSGIIATPRVNHGMVYVLTKKGHLAAYRLTAH